MFDQPVASVQTTLVFLGGFHFSAVQVFASVKENAKRSISLVLPHMCTFVIMCMLSSSTRWVKPNGPTA